MYLKSIEIQGFKSFANKLVFEFHKGITGIVGPNGSGKSNVADAVRWVLGEQKVKQLRGSKMEDVIFSGTETRRPLGFAYVAITLDNSDHKLNVDYDELTVSRRLFRSGESEYRINGASCRLRDIQEIFYDTGIGKEGYSIIGQGQIDKILSGKMEERRELFDEAAGIVKYKRRRMVAEKKLEDERENLSRVEDILSELERRVHPLERQAETARQYLRLRDSLKERDANRFLMDMDQIQAQLKEIEEKRAAAAGDLEETTLAFDEIRATYEQLEKEMEELELHLSEASDRKSNVQLSKEKMLGQIRLFKEQIRSIQSNDEYVNSRLEQLRQQVSVREEELEHLKAAKEGLGNEVAENLARQEDCSAEIFSMEEESSELEGELEAKNEAFLGLMNEKSVLQARMERYGALREQADIRREELLAQSRKKEEDVAKQREDIEDFKRRLSEINENILHTESECRKAEQEAAGQKKELESCREEKDRGQVRYLQEKNRLESLKNLAERYEGYAGTVRKIMERKENHPGVIGVVADIIRTEKKYETAVETALGGNIQNIVTDCADTAKELIEFLKKNKLGRATFLPLSELSSRQQETLIPGQRGILAEPGVIGIADSLVSVEEKYKPVARFLLGRFIVTEHIDQAIALNRKYRHSLRIVTLEGELLSPGGSMSGGAFKNKSNLLGRHREIQESEKKLYALEKEGKALGEKYDSAVQRSLEAEKRTEALRQKMQEQRISQNTIKASLQAYENREMESRESLTDYEKERANLEEQLAALKEDCRSLDGEMDKVEKKRQEIENSCAGVSAGLADLKQKLDEKRSLSEELKVARSAMLQKIDSLDEMTGRYSEDLRRIQEEYRETAAGSESASSEIRDRQTQIAEFQLQAEKMEEEISALSAEISSLTEEKERKTKYHREFFEKREEISARISDLDKEIYRLDHQKERQEEAKEDLSRYMWNEYELTYNQALPLRNPELTSGPQLKKSIQELKDQIRGLGNVNVNAIEEYKEVSERYNFLTAQHDDLIRAEQNLMGVIKELESGMRRQFSEKLEDIRREFDRVFKELFGGGSGTIELNTEEDILEAGISIISQPPGKKLQNMMQLSGGEKALTAIALLFAFQSLKPSPFCLLDEIEAALDGSNVTRFARYLHKLTDNTQFIVITHRRGTMACADRLYGITMQEKGISTLISVDLIEKQLDK